MARPLSDVARRAIFAGQTGEVFLILLTIAHPTLPQPLRVTSDGRDTVSRGERFQRFPFEITMPESTDAAPPTVALRICNVDRRITEAVRVAVGEGTPIAVRMEVVLASSPDVVECGPFDFKLREVTYDAIVVEGSLRMEDLLNDRFPVLEFTPASHPGLFQ